MELGISCHQPWPSLLFSSSSTSSSCWFTLRMEINTPCGWRLLDHLDQLPLTTGRTRLPTSPSTTSSWWLTTMLFSSPRESSISSTSKPWWDRETSLERPYGLHSWSLWESFYTLSAPHKIILRLDSCSSTHFTVTIQSSACTQQEHGCGCSSSHGWCTPSPTRNSTSQPTNYWLAAPSTPI